jgi:hypothetical protein
MADPGDPLGIYRVKMQTTDHIAKITLTTETDLTITEAAH